MNRRERKKERHRVKRIKVLRGRLKAFGSKSYPEDVRKVMLEAKRKRKSK